MGTNIYNFGPEVFEIPTFILRNFEAKNKTNKQKWSKIKPTLI